MDTATNSEDERCDPSYVPGSDDESDLSVNSEYAEDDDGKVFLKLDRSLLFEDAEGKAVHPFLDEEPGARCTRMTIGRIAFRVWNPLTQGTNTATGIWAGQLLSNGHVIPSRNDHNYMRAVVQHLQRVEKSSPLISIWNSSISAIHKLITSKDSTVAFLDLDYLGRERIPYLGGDLAEFPRVQPATSLMRQYRILQIGYPDGSKYGSNYTYRGTPELLVWQHIESHAIHSTLSRHEFDLHLNQNPDLRVILDIDKLSEFPFVEQYLRHSTRRVLRNYRVGYALGRFFQRVEIPPRFLQSLAKEFARGFEFIQGRPEQEIKDKEDPYLKGIWRGFHSRLPTAGVTVTPASIVREALFPRQLSGEVKIKRVGRPYITQKKKSSKGKDAEDIRPGTPNEIFSTRPSQASSSALPYNTILFRPAAKAKQKEAAKITAKVKKLRSYQYARDNTSWRERAAPAVPPSSLPRLPFRLPPPNSAATSPLDAIQVASSPLPSPRASPNEPLPANPAYMEIDPPRTPENEHLEKGKHFVVDNDIEEREGDIKEYRKLAIEPEQIAKEQGKDIWDKYESDDNRSETVIADDSIIPSISTIPLIPSRHASFTSDVVPDDMLNHIIISDDELNVNDDLRMVESSSPPRESSSTDAFMRNRQRIKHQLNYSPYVGPEDRDWKREKQGKRGCYK